MAAIPRKTANRTFLHVLGLLCGSIVCGCGSELEGVLSGINLLPDASTISLDVREACEGMMSEQEMLTSILAAQIDQANGYTKSEQLLNVTTNCALDAAFTGVSADDCAACKTAILDQIYGR
jgi:hypothetical protein